MSDSLHVGYILKQYPRLSETFILNEILGLEERGIEVSIFSLRHATEGRFHPGVASVKGAVHYMADTDKAAFLDAMRALPRLRTEQLEAVFDFLEHVPAERRARLLLHAIEVANAAIDEQIDHFHAHFMTIASHTAYMVHLLTGIPYTVTAHAKDIYRHTVDWNLAALIASNAESVVTVCDANLTFLAHRLDGSGARLRRIYNGLGPQDHPAPMGHRIDGLVLGVGRLVEKKGFDLLLEAVSSLSSSHPNIRCVLIGDGDQRSALEKLADNLDIAEFVSFTGPLPQHEVAKWLRRASVMAAPCRIGLDGNQDALPTVLLEGLGAGLPAVTTPVAGVPEIITDGVEGLIVPTDDAAALATAIEHLLDRPDLSAEMSKAGPIKLTRAFDRAATITQLIDTFHSRESVA